MRTVKNFLIVLLWIVWAFVCLFTIPVYLVTYPFVWLVSGFKHIPWWWWATDWLEDKMPGPIRKTVKLA